MKQSKDQLLSRKEELVKRIQAIRSDIGRGLDADSKEQAIELENMDVLQEIYRLADEELQAIEQQLADLH
jgi:hypothetical protein